MSETKALSERCEQQCFAKGFVELRTVVRSFSVGDGEQVLRVNPDQDRRLQEALRDAVQCTFVEASQDL